MATVTEYDTADGKRYKVEWDLPKRMLPPGKNRGKGSLTVKTPDERDTVKQMAELVKHAITGQQIAEFLKQSELQDDSSTKLDDEGLTVGEWLPDFLASKKGRWNGKHGHDQTRRLRDIIVPALGENRSLSSIEGKEIDDLCWALREGTLERSRTKIDYEMKPVAFKTVDNFWDLMRQFFDLAHKRGLIVKNPMAFVSWQKGMVSDGEEEINKHADRYFEPEEFEAFLGRIRPDYQLLIELLVETGLRFAEATALKVRDIDFKHHILTVRRAYKGYFPGGGGETGTTKNRQWRMIELTDDLLEKLQARIEGLGEQKGIKDRDDRWLFRGTRGGVILNSNFRRDHWNPAMITLQQCPNHMPTRIDGRNGLPVIDKKSVSTCGCLGEQAFTSYTPHCLRHTFATWLIDEGESIERVSLLLGHSSTKVTEEVYVHQIRRKKQYRRSASALDRKRGRVRAVLQRAA